MVVAVALAALAALALLEADEAAVGDMKRGVPDATDGVLDALREDMTEGNYSESRIE